MVLMAINKANDCLVYIANIREQSVFNFVAILQSMAIATLELCFQNSDVFERNVKITKGAACRLMIESTQDFQPVCEVFKRHATKIQRKNNPSDPHYHDIDAACEKIKRSAESILSTYDQTPRADKVLANSSERKAQNTTYWALAIFAAMGVIVAIMVRGAHTCRAYDKANDYILVASLCLVLYPLLSPISLLHRQSLSDGGTLLCCAEVQ